MATRSTRKPGQPAEGSSAGERADLNGTRHTETIKGSGQVVPRKQAGHMTALDQRITSQKSLANKGPSTHDL